MGLLRAPTHHWLNVPQIVSHRKEKEKKKECDPLIFVIKRQLLTSMLLL